MIKKINHTLHRIRRFDVIQKKIIANEQMVIKSDKNNYTLTTSHYTEEDLKEDMEMKNIDINQKQIGMKQIEGKKNLVEQRGTWLGVMKKKQSIKNIDAIKVNNDENNNIVIQNIINEKSNDKSNEENENEKLKQNKKDKNDKKNDKDDQTEFACDELTALRKIFYDNLFSFKIVLEVGENFYKNNPVIVDFLKEKKMKLYNNVVFQSKEKLKQKLDKPVSNIFENLESEVNASTYSQNFDNNDINLLLMYEILSTEVIDFTNYRQNFFFKVRQEEYQEVVSNSPKKKLKVVHEDYTTTSLFNFYDCINKFLYNDENNINDITNGEKVTSLINYFIEVIHKKWMVKMDLYINKK